LSKKTQEKTNPRPARFLLPGLVALAIVALAGAAVLLSANPGGSPSGAELGQRPYVGGDLHSIAVDPTNPEKVMVGGTTAAP
jgi:hypothetical protein